THLNSINCAFFSTWRYSVMLIFHGLENVFESSMVASYCIWSGPVRVNLSTTCRLSLAKFPARSNHAKPFRPVTSTTSVSPSHLPLDVPIQVSDPASTGFPMLTSRLALAYSYTNRMSLLDCTI